jgi:hypothetical protein
MEADGGGVDRRLDLVSKKRSQVSVRGIFDENG